MPQLVTVRVTRPDGRPIRLWVPVLPVVLVLSPLLVLATVGAIVACIVFRINLVRALGACWRVISALPGSRFDVKDSETAILVAIR